MLCAVVAAFSCYWGLLKAVPVQEYNSMLATGDFGAHLTTAAVKRKLTLLHRWLQKPLVVMLSVRINVTCR